MLIMGWDNFFSIQFQFKDYSSIVIYDVYIYLGGESIEYVARVGGAIQSNIHFCHPIHFLARPMLLPKYLYLLFR
jgi:hypothetical protein